MSASENQKSPSVSTGAEGEDDFRFDVIISLPMSIDKAILHQRAVEGLGVPVDAVDRLMASLSQHRILKVKSAVDRATADETGQKFEKVGFRVEIAHCLGLRKAEVKTDDRIECPACETKIVPSADQQCPSCGVFLNKLSADFLERKRIMKRERARLEAMLAGEKSEAEKKLRAEMEKRMRDEILAELEKEFGITREKKGFFAKLPRWALPSLGVVAVAGAFFGGRTTGYQAGETDATKTVTATLSAQQAAAARAANEDDDVAKLEAQTIKMKADMAAAAGFGKALTGGGGGSGGGAAPSVDPKDSLGAPTAASDGGKVEPPANPITNDGVKREVAYELVMLLAEIGQIDRARELVSRAVAGSQASTDVKLALQIRFMQLEVEAWALVHGRTDKPQEQADALLKSVGEIPDAGERSIAGASIGAILLRRPDLSPQTVDALFKIANDSYKTLKGKPTTSAVGHAVVVARGRGLLNASRARIDRGMMQQALPLAQELSAMAKSVSDPAGAVLYGFDHEVNRWLGNGAGAQKSLELAFAKARKSTSLQQEGATLRSIMDGGNVYQSPNAQTAIAALTAAAQKWGGSDYAAVLVELGLIHARNGNDQALADVQGKLAELIKASPHLIVADERLRGMTEVTLAWRAKKANDPAKAEEYLRRAAALVN